METGTRFAGEGSGRNARHAALLSAAVVGCAILASSVGVSTPSAAPNRATTAYKCAFFGAGIKGPVRNGQFCATVAGTRLFVSSVTGSFGFVVPWLNQVCLPSMKIDFYDASGRWYSWQPGGRRSGCYGAGAIISVPSITLNRYVRSGSARVTLLSADSPVAEIWYGIY